MHLNLISCDTPVGPFHMIAEEDVVRVSGFGNLQGLQLRLPLHLMNKELIKSEKHLYCQLIDNYFKGNAQALDGISYSQEGSEFNHAVWKGISSIGSGKVISYKELAVLSGRPAAIRAAGTICGRNRLILLVPCHRVVKTGGGIGSYLYGPEIKHYLLKLEGVSI